MSSTVAETLPHTAPGGNPTAVVDRLASKLPSELFQRLLPLRPSEKRPFRVSEGGFRWGDIGRVDASQVHEWADTYSNCGWAIRTGRLDDIGPNLVVVDIDHPDKLAVNLDWDNLWVVATKRPGGSHLYGYVQEPIRQTKLLAGDLKAQGGYVVAPLGGPGEPYRPFPGFGQLNPTPGGLQLPLWSMPDLERLTISGQPLQLVRDVTRQSGPQMDANGKIGGQGLILDSPDRGKGYVGECHPTLDNESLNNHGLRWGKVPAPIRASAGERYNTLWPLLLKAMGNHPEHWGDVDAVTALAFMYASHFDRDTGHAFTDTDIRSAAAHAAQVPIKGGWVDARPDFLARQTYKSALGNATKQAAREKRNSGIILAHRAGLPYDVIARRVGMTQRQAKRIVQAARW